MKDEHAELVGLLEQQYSDAMEDWAEANQPVHQGGPGPSGFPPPNTIKCKAAQAIRSLSAEVDEAEGLLTEIRQWMDAEMGEWDAKFIAKIDAFLTRKEKDG